MSVVLFVSYSGILGGAERILVDWATPLDGERCVACPEGPLAQAARESGLRVFPLGARRLDIRASARDRLLAPVRLAGHALEVRGLVRDLDPDLTVAWGMRSAIACLGARRGSPVAFQHNDMLPARLIGVAVRAAARRSAVVIVLSHAMAEDLDPHRRLAGRLRVVHPGVDVDPAPPDRAPAQPPEVLVLGALVGWKRPDLALEACALVRRHRPDVRLRYVGAPLGTEDPIIELLHERAGRPDLAGAVEFAGARVDPRPDLARATCLLHCAPREPFGRVVLEALAAGRPAVVPDGGGPKEIVDGSCGILYPPGDPAAAADAIIELLATPERAAAMGSAGRRRARAWFNRGESAAAFAAAIAPVTRTRSPRALSASAGSLSLVTVTHNSEHELEALLRSVQRHLDGVRVVVVDCASEDRSVEVARSRAWVRTIALGENVGFGRACNRGLRDVGEAVTVLVNPDVELLDDSLLGLGAEALRADRPQRLLAPLVLSADGSRQDTVHPSPGSPADLIRALIPPVIVPGRAGDMLAPWRARAPRHVGWAVGCAIAARTETLLRLGPFDEGIFMYGEDLELGLRAAEHGVQTWFWPRARVLHHRAHSTERVFGGEAFELLASARHDVVARRMGAGPARLDDAAQALTFASRWILKRALGRAAGRERRQLQALALTRFRRREE